FDRVHINHNLAIASAKGLRHRCAGYVCDLVANLELRQIFEPGLIQAFPFQRYQTNWKARGIELKHHRRQSTWRQTSKIGHRQVRDVAKSGIAIAPRLEVNLDQAYTRQRAGFDVVDVAAEGKKALERIGNVRLDLLRRHPCVKGRNHHHWNLDLREQIHRHPNHGRHAHDGDHQTKHDDEERVLQSESRHYFRSPV